MQEGKRLLSREKKGGDESAVERGTVNRQAVGLEVTPNHTVEKPGLASTFVQSAGEVGRRPAIPQLQGVYPPCACVYTCGRYVWEQN